MNGKHVNGTSWAAAIEFVTTKCQATDAAFVIERIVPAARQRIIDLGRDPEQLTDEALVEVMREATGRSQRSAAYYLKTVPKVIENWIRKTS
jgi:hypothetical protein